MSSLLVIGGTGFFGNSILDSYSRGLLDKWEISELHIASRGITEIINYSENKLVVRHKLDVCTMDEIPKVDYIIHAAAPTDIPSYLGDGTSGVDVILKGASNFCDHFERQQLRSKILFISSGAVYGDNAVCLPSQEDDLPNFDSQNYPLNKKNYAMSKLMAEYAFKNLGKSGADVAVARCFSFFGRYLPLNKHYAIGNFINGIINNRTIEVKSKMKVYRSYMCADDLVEWLMTILFHSSSSCPIYNVGSSEVIEIHDLAQTLAKSYGCTLNSEDISEDGIDYYIPSTSKAETELGLKLHENIFQTISSLINDYD
jgi:dTDP-glucose 4,6-dehydratase